MDQSLDISTKIYVFRYIRFASKSCGFEGRHVLRYSQGLKSASLCKAQAQIRLIESASAERQMPVF